MKLLFLDLDGTLLNDKKEINKADMDAIDEMISKGHKVIINTGRPLYSALLLSEKFGFLREGFYISSFNGGLIVDPVTKKRLKYDTVPDEIVRHMFDEAYKLGLHAHTYNDEYVVSERDTKELEFYTKRISMPPFVVSDFRDALSEGAPKIIIVSLDGKERLIEYREKLRDYENEHNLYSTFSDSRLLEYANPLANKGEAVRFLCRYLGVDISDSIAAGDEENDMPTIEAARIGVCTKNGQATLKSVADYVTERTNNECGIKEIIEKFILNSLCQHI